MGLPKKEGGGDKDTWKKREKKGKEQKTKRKAEQYRE